MVKKSNVAPKDIYMWDINEWKEFIKALENLIKDEKMPHEIKLTLINMVLTDNKTTKFSKKAESILSSKKKPWAKKLALFNLVKDLPIGESPEEKEKNNHLLESYLFTEFAKRSMEEYKKSESRKH